MKILIFLFGVVIGAVATYFFVTEKFLNPIVYGGALNHAAAYTRALTYFRDGKTEEALNILELKLDGELITFLNFDSGEPRITSQQYRIFSQIADYRKKYPRKTEHPEIDSTVNKVLSMPAPTTSP